MTPNPKHPSGAIEKRVEDLLKKMSRQEKISLLSGKDLWNTVPIERLGVPSITMTDGPHGVRAANPETGRVIGPTTCFPTGISMAASWNPQLVEQVGQALGEETRGMDCDILLGPCVNIVRTPLGGRNFESYSEDPYLAGRMAVAYIKGVQSQGVGTSLKHYAVNNYEIERFRASSNIDERTLREIYLAQFEMAVKESQPWTVMCSYNRINGIYASQHDTLLNKILRDEWGFQGSVISDWGANHSIFESVANGLDLEMPGPAKYYRLLGEAVDNWQIDEEAVNQAARRILRLVLLSGRMDGTTSKGSVNTPAHQKLARELAEEAITLLKNENNILPIDPNKVRRIAVIGPNAAEAVIEGGGSSRVEPPYRINPLDALRKTLGNKVTIEYERGCDNYDEPFDVPISWLPGMRSAFYASPDCTGEPLLVQENRRPELWYHIGWSTLPIKPVSFRWTGQLTPPDDGLYRFHLNHSGMMYLYLNDELVMKSHAPDPMTGREPFTTAMIDKSLKGGEAYSLRIDLVCYPTQDIVFTKLGLGRTYPAGKDPRLARAIALARKCDLALIFAGLPESFESEGRDRSDMDLPGEQDALIQAVAQANPNTVVVLNAGSPVSMPWLDGVAALVEAYYPGQENGQAVARVLLGKANPSGKLPITFPKRLEDHPAFLNSSYYGCRQVNYGEGIFVGYRYYDAKEVEPLFPFGHGLSYTTFEYGKVKAPRTVKSGESFEVSLTVKNTGKVAGKEVVQLYVADKQSSLPRPPIELKGFAKISLLPGESQVVTFTLDPRALSFYDPQRKQWVAEPGAFEVQFGASSRDIRAKATFTLK